MKRRFVAAFTMVEMLVIVVVFAVLVMVLMPPLLSPGAMEKAKRIKCMNTLKNIGLAERIFAVDNGALFPWERSLAAATNLVNFPVLTGLSEGAQVARVYQTLSNELSTPKLLVCPADGRKEAMSWTQLTTNNISYFVGLSARGSLPQSIMAGDRNLVLDGKEISGRVELKRDAAVAFDKGVHRTQGNIALGDGSVHQLSSERLREVLKNTGVETNVVLIP